MEKKKIIDLKKFKYYSLLAKLSLKTKRSKCFVVNNEMQKNKFLEVIRRNDLLRIQNL